MVERVGEQRIAFADQRGDDADVGGVAGVEVQRARQSGEAGQFLFERLVRRAVAADQGRGAGAHAELALAPAQAAATSCGWRARPR